MRIEKVVIENINSLFGRYEIDFTDEAYAEGLFAIVGPSGAGKSTILDAMCLALYGRTPRITVSDMHDEAMNRNAEKARAEVVFVSGGKKYWSVFEHRKTIRSAKPFMSPKNELFESAGDMQKAISDNSTQAKQKVIEIIGLDYDQFTRSVMLAQFKFAEFLSANSGQRAEILEQVSGTDIYRRISVAVFNKQKQYKTQLDEIRIRKETVSVLEPEQESQIRKELTGIDERAAGVDALKQKADEYNAAVSEKTAQQAALAAFEEKWKLIDKALQEKTAVFAAAQEMEKSLKKQGLELAATLKAVRELDHGILASDKDKARLSSEDEKAKQEILDNKRKILGILKKHLPDAQDGELKQIYDADNDAQIIREHIDKALKEAESRQEALRKEKLVLLKSKKDSEWHDRQQKLESVLPLIEAQAQTKQAQEDLERLKAEHAKLIKDEEKLNNKIRENDEKFLFAKLQEKYSDQRKQLKDGEPCPLCGALEHPGAHEHIDTSFLKDAEEEKKALSEQKKKIEDGITDINYSVKQLSKTLSENEAALKGNEKLLEEFTASSAESVRKETEQVKKTLSEARKLSEEAGRAGDDVLRLTKQMSEVDRDAEQIKHAKETIRSIEKRSEETGRAMSKAVKESEKLKAQRRELFGEKDADAEEKRHSKEADKAAEAVEKARSSMETANADKVRNSENIERTKKMIEKLSVKAETSYSEVLQMAKTVEEMDFAEQTDTYEAVMSSIAGLGADAMQSKEVVAELSAGLGEMSKALGVRKGEARQTLSINEQNKKLVKELLSAEKQTGEEFKKWSDLNSLIGSSDGIKFSRIAQGITFDVLLRFANESLKKMSDRYILVRDSSSMASPLEINVIDNYQAGEQRPVSNLSGGESFVVSLALALGLSEMSSGRTQIDSLFIDEGFASLDENYLELALQTLSTLGNRQNKLIGVISHVKELKERIDTQIEVTPLSGGRSSMEGPGVSAGGIV